MSLTDPKRRKQYVIQTHRRFDADRAGGLRHALVDELRTQGKITTGPVEAAFREVPRERFMPAGTDLDAAYGFDHSIITKRDEYGVAISSVSAAYIQARMLEQAELAPGMSVLEVGSGGLNAAYIAQIVGPQGRVVSVDIDPQITDRAAALLKDNGYDGRVQVLTADAGHGVPSEGTFDAIIVTVGMWDIAPALLDQLQENGILILPLIMNGVTRTIGLRREGEHLTSTSVEVAGFVPMQGTGRHPDRVFLLPDTHGRHVRLSFDSSAPDTISQLDAVLATGRAERWSGVTIGNNISFADLHLWLAWFLPGFCRVTADEGTDLAAERGWFPFGVVHGSGLAYLAVRPTPEDDGVEFGARAYGPHGQQAATVMVEQIQAWDRDGRHTAPTFSYWPTGSDRSALPTDAAVMDKTHGAVSISWPTTG